VLLNKNFEGKIPDVLPDPRAIIEDAAFELRQYQKALHQNINGYIHRYEFRNALQEILNVARVANKFLTDTEPWKLIKTNPDQAGAVLTICAEIIAYFAVYLEPFLPFSANKLRHWLLLSNEDIVAIKNNAFTMETGRRILNTNEYLFRKIEDAEIAPYIAQLEAKRQTMLDAQKTVAEATTETQTVATHTPVKEAITYDDFAKLDIRTATIIAAERVPKADKLLKLTIDLGFEQRTVVSGIAEHYTPESIVGQRVLLLANLAPRKLRGIESNGMILMAGDGKTLQFVSPEGEIENGNVVS
jgi:methionyl-tRNA synthetase